MKRRDFVLGIAASTALSTAGCAVSTPKSLAREKSGSNFKDWAKKPPMGWNSYNCYGAAVRENEILDNAMYLAKELKPFGWEYITVDFCWFYPHPVGSIQSNPPQFNLPSDGAPVPWLAMDEFGRLLPAVEKFPSAVNGKGFKPLADAVHKLGLKFGIHIMRGVPRQAVWAKTPIKNAPGIDASMIADTRPEMQCKWLNNMYAIDMSKPGAQEYCDSLAELYASWEVDFIKMDDVDGGAKYHADEVAAIRKAIDKAGRPIVLSLSLNLKYHNREHIRQQANMWRISKDFWDDWPALKEQFNWCHQWESEVGEGYGPDADMLALGVLSKRGPKGEQRNSHFTDDEQRTHMTLWSIFRSPLIMGGNLPELTPVVKALLTNSEVNYVNQYGKNPRQYARTESSVVWVSEDSKSSQRFVALFNIGDTAQKVSFDPAALNFSSYQMRNLWEKQDLGITNGIYSAEIPPHGSLFYRITPV